MGSDMKIQDNSLLEASQRKGANQPNRRRDRVNGPDKSLPKVLCTFLKDSLCGLIGSADRSLSSCGNRFRQLSDVVSRHTPDSVKTHANRAASSVAALATLYGSYSLYELGNLTVASSEYIVNAIPTFTTRVTESGWFSSTQTINLSAVFTTPAKWVKVPVINDLGHVIRAVAMIVAVTTFVAHSHTTKNTDGSKAKRATAVKDAGFKAAFAMAVSTCSTISEKVIGGMPVISGLLVAGKVYTCVTQLGDGNARKAINGLAAAAVGVAGVCAYQYAKQGVEFVASLDPVVSALGGSVVVMVAVAMGADALASKATKGRHSMLKGLGFTAACVAGVAAGTLAFPGLMLLDYNNNKLIIEGLQVAIAGATAFGIYKTVKATSARTAGLTNRLIGAGAAVVAGIAMTVLVVPAAEAYVPGVLAPMIFSYSCGQVGKRVGAVVNGIIATFECSSSRPAIVIRTELGPDGGSAPLGTPKTSKGESRKRQVKVLLVDTNQGPVRANIPLLKSAAEISRVLTQPENTDNVLVSPVSAPLSAPLSSSWNDVTFRLPPPGTTTSTTSTTTTTIKRASLQNKSALNPMSAAFEFEGHFEGQTFVPKSSDQPPLNLKVDVDQDGKK